jgi:hypothetical protein
MADNSNSARITRLKNKTLSIFYARNSGGIYVRDESIRQQISLGARPVAITTSAGVRYDISACCIGAGDGACVAVDVTDARIDIPVVATVSPPYLGTYNYSFTFGWSGFVGATSYELAVTTVDPYTVVSTGATSAIVYVNVPTSPAPAPGSRLLLLTVTGSNACSSEDASYGMGYPPA